MGSTGVCVSSSGGCGGTWMGAVGLFDSKPSLFCFPHVGLFPWGTRVGSEPQAGDRRASVQPLS